MDSQYFDSFTISRIDVAMVDQSDSTIALHLRIRTRKERRGFAVKIKGRVQEILYAPFRVLSIGDRFIR